MISLILILILFIFGTIFSSFVSLVGFRVPLGISIIYPGSSCSNCKKSLGFLDLIPVFSYLISKGKCRYCGVHYGSFHFNFEIILGSLFSILGYLIFIDNGISYSTLLLLIVLILLLSLFNINWVSVCIHNSILLRTNLSIYLLCVLVVFLISIYFNVNYLSYVILFLTFLLSLSHIIKFKGGR